jgi:hypothetical protein
MRKLISTLVLALAALALSATALANGGGGSGHKGKQSGKGERAKLTYTVTTTDNGSCGNAWATDVVKRTFFVKQRKDGSYLLVRFDRGEFVTLAGKSPGACDTTGAHGQTIRAGVQGRMHGFIAGKVTGGTFDKNATCTGADCGFTDTFLRTHFGPNAQFSCFTNSADCAFNFKYKAYYFKNRAEKAEKQSVTFRHWQDKGVGAGTMLKEEFNGDIADA